jgi:diguanylate cyclase (GGDEF)-like protein
VKRTVLALLALAVASGAAASAPIVEPGLATALEAGLRKGMNWPDEALRDVDALTQKTPDDEVTQRAALIVRGSINANAGRAEAAIAQADELAALGQRAADSLALAGADLVRARLAVTRARGEEAAEFARSALAAAKASCAQRSNDAPPCDHAVAWEALDIIARYEENRGVIVSARSYSQAAYDLARDAADVYRQARSLAHLGYLSALAGETDSAWRQFAQAERLARQYGTADLLAQTKLTGSAIAARFNQYERVRRASEEALPLARAAHAPRLEARALTNLSDALVKTHHPAEALNAVERAMPIVRGYNDRRAEIILLTNGCLAKIGLGRIADGRADLERLLEQLGRSGATARQARVLREFSDALADAGDLRGALELYHRERALTEEFTALNRKTALDELHQRYDREAKQKSIDLLSRDNALKSAELENRRLQQRIWLTTGTLAALAAMLVGVLYGRVRETNRRLAESHAWLRVQSQRDPLTGLANRRHFQDVMSGVAGRAGAFEGALLLVDVDHFKHVNDGHGHETGDKVLKEIAQRLKDVVRSEDLVVRWGGEEFLVFAPHVNPQQARGLAQRVLRNVGDASVPLGGGASLRVTVSIGYGRFPLPPHELCVAWEQAVNLADMALYTAKSQGRNRAVGIGSIAASNAEAMREVERDFEGAWAEGRVTLLMDGATA